MQGYLDSCINGIVSGWAEADNGAPAHVTLLLNGRPVGSAMADLPRGDLGRAVGFRIEASCPVSAGDVLDDRLSAWSASGDGPAMRLPVAGVAGLVETVLAQHLRQITAQELRELVGRVFERRRSADFLPAVDPRVAGEEVSSFDLTVGALSPDAVVTVGCDGHLFLLTGSNHLDAQYRRVDDAEPLAAAWTGVIETRLAALQARGIVFVQLLVPEKTSVLAPLVPFALDPPTPIYRALVQRLGTSPAAPCLLDAYPELVAATDRPLLYRPLDSHLSSRGTHRLFSMLMAQIGYAVPETTFTRAVRRHGDLGDHFPWIGMLDTEFEPDPAALSIAGEPVILDEDRPERHLGGRIVFRNPHAPIDRRVVVFGNSFFRYGEASFELSWWFARWFAEFHFVWSHEIDLAYVDAVRPQVVIAQTIERFLLTVPGC